MKLITATFSAALAIGVSLALIASDSAQAQVIAQWSDQPFETDIVGASQNFVIADPNDYPTYVAGTAINPTVGANYYPNNAGRTPIFNGAFSEIPTGKALVFQPGNPANPDQIQAQVGATAATQFSGMFTFENLLPGTTDPLLSFSMQRYRFGAGFDPNGPSGSRFLFQDSSSQWYASDPSPSLPTGLSGQVIANVPTANWYAFTPFSSGVASIASAPSAGLDFTNVLAVGMYFDIAKTSGSGVGFAAGYFQAATGIAGDFDGNGVVDGLDFLLWQQGGTTPPLGPGLLALWEANYGAGGLAAATAAVPEPSSVVLLAIMAAAGALTRRRI